MDFKNIIGHEDIISRFMSSIETDRVSHAYIIAGEEGSGRYTLAEAFAKTLQCEEGGSEACGHCKSCKQAETDNHPDIITITHDKDTVLSVDLIRTQVVDTMGIKPYSSKYKIYIIRDAEMMNEEAQNALLKTIEEPPEYGIIILITKQLERLLPTIQSRSLVISTKPVKEKDIHNYLESHYGIDEEKIAFAIEYGQGNLGKAILLATNEEYEGLVRSVIDLESNLFDMTMDEITEAIKRCSNYKMNICDYLDLMMMWYRDILVLKVTGNPDRILFKAQYSVIKEQAKYLSFNELDDKQRAIEAAKKRIAANADMEDIMRLLIMTLKEGYS
ncbi:DNA polymerase-3 subunit delta' [Lachnospiraceae bacterium NE2001]|nr:DNA polymerase-3 subunit delta' [Lachnospiraceae bacterium NE2001]